MKLITYYGLLQPKTVYRVVVEDDKVRGYYQHPGDARWHWTGSVAYEIQQNGAVEITRSDARAILAAWQGQMDELDEHQDDEIETELADAAFEEEFPPLEAERTVMFPLAAMVPDDHSDGIDFDLWNGSPSSGPTEPDPVQESRLGAEHLAAFSPEEQEFLAAFEGGMLALRSEIRKAQAPLAEAPAGSPAGMAAVPEPPEASASFQAPESPPVLFAPPPPAEELPSATIPPAPAPTHDHEDAPAMNRIDAMAALRDLADGLSNLGKPGMSWA